MYPAPFAYRRPLSIDEALKLFAAFEEPAFLSGGHTLIPAMKNRLAAPDALIDLRSIPELHGISADQQKLIIGAATPHASVAASKVVNDTIPTLALLAGSIGDPQVRYMGTIGGSIANNDPSADYPAAVVGLGATVVTNDRSIPADAFFTGMFSTALKPGEIVLRVIFPIPTVCGYAKLCSLASRYAVAATFISRSGTDCRVAVTGAGSDGVFRWGEAERALADAPSGPLPESLLPDPDDLISDANGDGQYRAYLLRQLVNLALDHPNSACIR